MGRSVHKRLVHFLFSGQAKTGANRVRDHPGLTGLPGRPCDGTAEALHPAPRQFVKSSAREKFGPSRKAPACACEARGSTDSPVRMIRHLLSIASGAAAIRDDPTNGLCDVVETASCRRPGARSSGPRPHDRVRPKGLSGGVMATSVSVSSRSTIRDPPDPRRPPTGGSASESDACDCRHVCCPDRDDGDSIPPPGQAVIGTDMQM